MMTRVCFQHHMHDSTFMINAHAYGSAFHDLKCLENYMLINNIHRYVIFAALGHGRKLNQVKNKHMKYSRDLIWATYGMP